MPKESFQIEPNILRELREQSGKTQYEVGLSLRKKHSTKQTPHRGEMDERRSIISTYQKIERTGKTSKERAQDLAATFNVPIGVLQGLESIDTVRRIALLLKTRLSDARSEELEAAYTEIANELRDFSHEEIVRELANDIGERIEAAQWSRDQSELTALSSLTGLSESELLVAAYVEGNWWLRGSHSGEAIGSVYKGTRHLPKDIEETWPKDFFESYSDRNTSIRISRKGHQYRIEAEVVGIKMPWWVEITCCEPDGDKGIRWIPASISDQTFLENKLKSFAFEHADEVIDFSGRQWPENRRKLCLVVSIEMRGDNGSWNESRKLVFRGNLHEQPDELFKRWERNGSSQNHLLALLENDLMQSMHPHLKDYPASHWKVIDGDLITVTLDLPVKASGLRNWLEPARRYTINLMAELANGNFLRAPWKTTDVKRLAESIEKWMDEPVPESGEDDAIQSFELSGSTQ